MKNDQVMAGLDLAIEAVRQRYFDATAERMQADDILTIWKAIGGERVCDAILADLQALRKEAENG